MTGFLERAIDAARALSAEEQDAIAAVILEEIDDERCWTDAFARSHDLLAELAREAREEHGQRRQR